MGHGQPPPRGSARPSLRPQRQERRGGPHRHECDRCESLSRRHAARWRRDGDAAATLGGLPPTTEGGKFRPQPAPPSIDPPTAVIGRVMGRVLFSTPSLRLMLMRYGGTQLGEARSVRRIFTASLDNLAQLYGDYPGILHSVDVPASVVWGSGPVLPGRTGRAHSIATGGCEAPFPLRRRPLPARGTPRGGRERDRTPGGESDRAVWRTRI